MCASVLKLIFHACSSPSTKVLLESVVRKWLLCKFPQKSFSCENSMLTFLACLCAVDCNEWFLNQNVILSTSHLVQACSDYSDSSMTMFINVHCRYFHNSSTKAQWPTFSCLYDRRVTIGISDFVVSTTI